MKQKMPLSSNWARNIKWQSEINSKKNKWQPKQTIKILYTENQSIYFSLYRKLHLWTISLQSSKRGKTMKTLVVVLLLRCFAGIFSTIKSPSTQIHFNTKYISIDFDQIDMNLKLKQHKSIRNDIFYIHKFYIRKSTVFF